MPNREKRAMRRQRGSGILPALIIILALVAAMLVVVLVNSDPLNVPDEGGMKVQYPENPNFVDQHATAQPMILGADITVPPQNTAAIGATPTPAPTPEGEIVETGNRLVPEAEEGGIFLPVFDKALRTENDQAMIAVTVDDCDDAEVMEYVVDTARKYDIALTLFPTGEALMNEELTEGFRKCVTRYGYELENHTFNHKPAYQLTDSELAMQLWRQSIAASYAVDGDYQQHFFRPLYQGSDYDQRTHFYIRKLGYLGIGSYTHSYMGHDLDSLVKTLENGNVYQFDLTEESMALYEGFIRAAISKGYKLVTMNELFGLEENTVSDDLTLDQQTLPTMEDFTPSYYDLKLNYRTHAVYSLQGKLIQLGYLKEEKATGFYGPNTSIAVSAFQAKIGEAATGNATVNTQERMFSLNAPLAG